jgi:hypothetical protein
VKSSKGGKLIFSVEIDYHVTVLKSMLLTVLKSTYIGQFGVELTGLESLVIIFLTRRVTVLKSIFLLRIRCLLC